MLNEISAMNFQFREVRILRILSSSDLLDDDSSSVDAVVSPAAWAERTPHERQTMLSSQSHWRLQPVTEATTPQPIDSVRFTGGRSPIESESIASARSLL